MLSDLWLRLRALFRRNAVEAELDEELRFHLERQVEKHVRAGMTREEAGRRARLELGGLEQVKEDCRSARGVSLVETLLQDLRYGLRQLRRTPAFTTAAILTLALGIGANTAIFSMMNAVVLQALPVEHPGELVLFDSDGATGSLSGSPPARRWAELSFDAYQYFALHNQAFQGIAAFRSGLDALEVRWPGLGSSDQSERSLGHLVSGTYFQVLGVDAAAGRLLEAHDDAANARPVAVISYSYWQQRLNGDPTVIGRDVDLNGAPFTVVGVAARGFFGERMHDTPPDFWVPLTYQPQIMRRESWLTRKDVYWLNFVARLKPDMTRARATSLLNVQLRQFLIGEAGAQPSKAERNAIERAFVRLDSGRTGISQLRQFYEAPLSVLMVIVGLVLLVACANLANLLLSRSQARGREMAVRCAIGASRGRLIRQMLTESVLLGVLGGAAGLLVAYWCVHLLSSLVSQRLVVHVTTNPAVLAFTAATAIVTSLVFGLAPAWRLAADAPSSTPRAVGSTGRHQESWLAPGLIALQVAASLVLLSGAGLLTRTLLNLEHESVRFNPEHVLLVGVDPRLAGLQVGELNNIYQQLHDRLNALPGVLSASIAYFSPMSGYHNYTGVTVGAYTPHPNEDLNVSYDIVGAGYFETIGIPVLRGRPIGARDTAASGKVVVVNQAFVDKYMPGQNPLGRRIWIGRASYPPPPELPQEIIGVVGNARYHDAAEPAEPMAYIPLSQDLESYAGELEIRTAGDPSAAVAEIRQAVHDVDSALPIVSMRTLRQQVDEQLGQQALVARLSALFSMLALMLAVVGLYGMLAYWVSQRTGEIGVRLALGAQRADVVRLVVGRGVAIALLGIGAGLAVAFASTRLLARFLYGVTPADPLTFAIAAVLVGAAALVACLAPARLATRVDPIVALRHE